MSDADRPNTVLNAQLVLAAKARETAAYNRRMLRKAIGWLMLGGLVLSLAVSALGLAALTSDDCLSLELAPTADITYVRVTGRDLLPPRKTCVYGVAESSTSQVQQDSVPMAAAFLLGLDYCGVLALVRKGLPPLDGDIPVHH